LCSREFHSPRLKLTPPLPHLPHLPQFPITKYSLQRASLTPKLDLGIIQRIYVSDRPMSIPQISEFTIRRHANAKSFQRGEAYFEAGAVNAITQRGHLLQADVVGTEPRPYQVSLNFDSSGLTSVNCTCAYNLDGWCKHIVATMLVCARNSEHIEQRPTLEELLDRLDHIQTQRLLQELVAEYPRLIEAIDRGYSG
jgi:uncharacterized Zn finger protein